MTTPIKFKIETGGIGQKEGTLVIREDQITFARQTLRLDDILSISTSVSQRTEVLYSTINAKILLRGRSEKMTIKLSASNFLRMGKAEDVLQNYYQVRDAIIQFVGPMILSNLVAQICHGATIRIGGLTFDLRGVTGRNLIGTQTCAAWTAFPEVRYMTRSAMLSHVVKGECMAVIFHSQSSGKVVSVGSLSNSDENGCLAPILINMMIDLINRA